MSKNGFVVINEKDWGCATSAQKEWWTFNTLQSLDKRMQKLERRPIIDKCVSFAGGLVGGFCAACGIKWYSGG